MNNIMNKLVVAVFTTPLVFLLAFSTNSASAAVGSHEVEKTFAIECGSIIPIPGSDPLEVFYDSDVTIKTTVPDTIGPGKQFELTNTTVTWVTGFSNTTDDPGSPMEIENTNFTISSDNKQETVPTFVSDFDFTVPPNTENAPMIIPGDGAADVGPFTAGDEGEVTLTFDGLRLNIGVTGRECRVPEGEDVDTTFATIPIDDEAPVITLNGDDIVVIKQGDSYEELGATATDNLDGDVSDQIETSGDVDSDTIGTYTVTYTVSDSVGNETTVERIVNVVEAHGSWLTGEGAPNDELGSNGDLYLDTTTGDIYKRDPDKWGKIGNLKGDDGKQGSEILTGSGAPTADAGDVGDLYLDTKSGDVFEKTADGWNQIANLEGPEGPQGPQGSTGSGGDNGTGGDGAGKKPSTDKKVTAKGDDDGKGTTAKGGKLPKTATSLPTLILIGTLLATAGGILFLRRRKAIE